MSSFPFVFPVLVTVMAADDEMSHAWRSVNGHTSTARAKNARRLDAQNGGRAAGGNWNES